MFHLHYHPHYFSRHVEREVREIYWFTVLSSLAISLVFVFEPIYLYSIGFPLTKILLFYALVYGFYMALVSFGAKYASHFGYKHAILASNVFYVIYWILLFFIKQNPALFYIAPILYAAQKSWFWPAYDADMALGSVKVQRGREVGVLFSLMQIAFIVGPFLGGLISEKFGFRVLFAAAAILVLSSVYPLFRSPDIFSKHEFKFANLLDVIKKHKRNFFGHFGYAENVATMSIWPVFMFMVVPDFFNIGTIATIATAVGVVLMLYIGKVTDKSDKRKVIGFSALFFAVTWFFRFFGKGIGSILALDALNRVGQNITRVPVSALTFEHAASTRGPDYAIAYCVFYEFSLAAGQMIAMLGSIAILTAGLPIFWAFALIGIMTMFYGLLK